MAGKNIGFDCGTSRTERRSRVADVLAKFRDGFISNRDFDAQFEHAMDGDRELFQIWKAIWYSYSDICEHRLTGKHALSSEAAALFERCILFLRSGAEYRWAIPATLPERIRRFFQGAPAAESHEGPGEGDRDAWPFFTRDDYEKAKQASLDP